MTQRSRYDAIVIGAGHNGLALASYLQRAGRRTLLVEQASRVGGMTSTCEPMLPGYRHNPHANFLAYQSVSPIMADLRLRERGLLTLTPEVQHAIAFADGRPPVVVHRKDRDACTARSMAAHSARDAAAFLDLRRRVDGLTPSLRDVLFRPLSEIGIAAHRDAVLQAFRGVSGIEQTGTRGGAAVIDALFESPEVRTLFYLLAIEYGASLTQPGNDLAFLGLVLWMIGGREVPLGGMQRFADALHAAAREHGVDVRTSSPVTRIIVESGRVSGVEMAGKRVGAPLVVSSLGLRQTFNELLDAQALGTGDRQAAATTGAQPTPSIASQAFALREPPAYRSARWDPDLDRCVQTFIGFDTPADVLAQERDLAMGVLPPPRASVRVPSLWDPGMAPRGCHVAGADSHFPHAASLSDDEWGEIEAIYNDALLDTWREAAPNMHRDNVIASHFARPQAGDRQVVLRCGSQYRTSIDGLWLCGTATYPGGGVHGACAINAFQDITGQSLQ
ncbi:phytoene desaturase family protein [Solimonas terrae]|uniref:NAD(P)/FAD-dependent oxidoreductase n=1 Tax=Solimonas terrae TaxID=1396819 RepID=A0A6M2BMJ5_9GAMM|nr:NAD(P)/FAD-dependent oxidoreductase [Solimonas terrae]NGY03319.1 NAD(P)/FAD-dependent oxidoreductase [Solimonas terrae]